MRSLCKSSLSITKRCRSLFSYRNKHYSVWYSRTIIHSVTCVRIESIMIAVLRPVREN